MNELQQQIEWLLAEMDAAMNAAATRQDYIRLVQMHGRILHMAGLAKL